MNKFPNRAIIIGGGYSIKEGMQFGLFDKIKTEFTVGLNSAYKFIEPTIEMWVDWSFWAGRNTEPNKDKILQLNSLKICNVSAIRKENSIPNDIIPLYCKGNVRPSEMFSKKAVFSPALCGYFGLTITANILNKLTHGGEIYLLGYDFGDAGKTDNKGRAITHFYQGQIEHRGIGLIKYYKAKETNADAIFKMYVEDFPNIKIYNVSMISKINVFEKISYQDFFQKIKNNPIKINKPYVKSEIAKLLDPLKRI